MSLMSSFRWIVGKGFYHRSSCPGGRLPPCGRLHLPQLTTQAGRLITTAAAAA